MQRQLELKNLQARVRVRFKVRELKNLQASVRVMVRVAVRELTNLQVWGTAASPLTPPYCNSKDRPTLPSFSLNAPLSGVLLWCRYSLGLFCTIKGGLNPKSNPNPNPNPRSVA